MPINSKGNAKGSLGEREVASREWGRGHSASHSPLTTSQSPLQ